MSILTVYKASAGSGKTFQLTSEYLKLLFRNPENFRHILAVTFTHKATGEMKGRILKELHELSCRRQTEIGQTLSEIPGLDQSKVFEMASGILKLLLNHYSQFNVSTIDSFFQGIISSFARDLGLQGNFSVELNDEKVLSAVVDLLMIDLEKNPSLARWLVDFAEDQVLQGKSWELRREIGVLGRELFREEYAFEQLNKISGNPKQVIGEFIARIARQASIIENRLKEIGSKARDAISNEGLTMDDFSNKSTGVMGYLIGIYSNPLKEPTSRALQSIDSPEAWYNESSKKAGIIHDIVNKQLNRLLKEAVQLYREWITADLVRENLYTLGILADLRERISSFTREKNLFLLDHSPWLIHRLIDSNDAPFIYEKAGNSFSYYMIDEFQDTSKLQWKNFLPLIQNSLSQEKPCLVVGDVKQSIYRWRNSSWQTLADLKDSDETIEVFHLETNYRSKPTIIRFNNSLFTLAANILQEDFNQWFIKNMPETNPFSDLILRAYSELKQHIPEKKDDGSGYVAIKFLSKKSNSGEEGTEVADNVERALAEMKSFIDKLLGVGYQQKDIAILIRKKDEGRKAAEYLVGQNTGESMDYRVISNDSLYLASSAVIKLLVSLFTWLTDEKDEVNNLFLVSELSLLLAKQKHFTSEKQGFPIYFSADEMKPLFPGELIQSKEKLLRLPLYELAEHLIALLNLSEQDGQIPYLQAFLDTVHEYCSSSSTGIPLFLDWWKENSSLLTINAPENQDAIRIITIHKAKGLEFRAVIVPFCKWELDHSNPMPVVWCNTTSTAYESLGMVPVRYKKEMLWSAFAQKYYEEKIQCYVDNLNLLYVAFTRAKDCLYAICDMYGRKSNKISDLINRTFQYEKSGDLLGKLGNLGLNPFGKGTGVDIDIAEFGALAQIVQEAEIPVIPVLKKKITLPGKRIRVRAHGEEYFLSISDPAREEKINRGVILHEILERISVPSDVQPAAQRLVMEGKIGTEESIKIIDEIAGMIKDVRVAAWFDPGWKHLQETTILEKGMVVQRPDRVMIKDNKAVIVEYKSGEQKNDSHAVQVRRYMSALARMGFDEVQGFIWYLKLKEIDEIFQ